MSEKFTPDKESQEVRKIMERVEGIFLNRFSDKVENGGSGYSSLDEYEQAIRSAPELREIYRKLKEGKFEIWIDLPDEAYKSFLGTGKLMNVFETGKNAFLNGSERDTRHLNNRKIAEAKMLGLTMEEYEQLPLENRPNYGWLSEGE